VANDERGEAGLYGIERGKIRFMGRTIVFLARLDLLVVGEKIRLGFACGCMTLPIPAFLSLCHPKY